jgi:RNA polymerase-binding transcription factor DksA
VTLAFNLLAEVNMDTQMLESSRHKLLDRTGESEARELTRIRASLDRIAKGTFGDCAICHGAIETERLRAIPEADRCSGCSHR